MKNHVLLTLFLFLSVFSACAQNNKDNIPAKKGPIKIHPIEHASMVLQWNGKTIYVDPVGVDHFKAQPAPDLILITDIHGDHMDPKTLEAVNTHKAIIVAPQAVADKLPASLKDKLVVLNNGAGTTQLGIPIKAIPMYNLPEEPDARHPKGRGNGYVLELGGKNVYISGDTEDIPEMRSLQSIDIAFVCMNLPYTMSVEQAASAVLEFRPKIVYPYHYRGQDTEKFKQLVNAKDPSIDVRLRDWYH